MENKFKKSDVEDFVKFLNLVAGDMVSRDGIDFKKMNEFIVAYRKMQQLIPKLEANVFEISKVIEPIEKKEE